MKRRRRLTLDESFRRAYAAADPSPVSGVKKRVWNRKDSTARRFIGQSQIDCKYKGVRTDSNGSVRPWYICVLSIGRLRHKFSLGAPGPWKKHGEPLADAMVAELCCKVIELSLDEQDDDLSDALTAAVKEATKGARKDGTYIVRKTI